MAALRNQGQHSVAALAKVSLLTRCPSGHCISLTIVAVVVDRSVDIIHTLLDYRLLQDRTLVVSHFAKHLLAPTAQSGQLLRACESTKDLLADRS